MERSIELEEVEVEAQTETEAETKAAAEEEAPAKVLAGAKAEVDIIIVTKESQSEVIHLSIRNAQRSPKPVVQAHCGRKNDEDLDPEAKTLPQKQIEKQTKHLLTVPINKRYDLN